MKAEEPFDSGSATRLKRRLILCLDGTWNTADGATITNIVRLRDMIRPGVVEDEDGTKVEQRIYYDEGVGTRDLYDRYTGGGFGFGLDRNVRQGYRFLCQFYQPGDEIYIFGFSRGAFTARSLGGYVGASGLLTAENCTPEMERRAWDNYRCDPKDRYANELLFLARHTHPNVKVKVLGVFDTVGALGVPLDMLKWWNRGRFEFHDTRISSAIEFALQAVAVDEKRAPFRPSLWERPYHSNYNRVEQVWFPGVHSDIGGGYADCATGMVALGWMTSRLKSLGRRFGFSLGWRRNAMELIKPDETGALHESRTAPYAWNRLRPSIRLIAQQRPEEASGFLLAALPPHARSVGEMLHLSVLRRWKNGGTDADGTAYAPRNVAWALDAMLAGKPVDLRFVGASGERLRWVDGDADFEELAAAMPTRQHADNLAALRKRRREEGKPALEAIGDAAAAPADERAAAGEPEQG